jgi:MoaA/NifB/PqqE/SkfB family radical SAM enzyme
MLVNNVQIETSTICNAACPQCLRESKYGDHSFFQQKSLPTDFYDLIPDSVYKSATFNFCGTLGDPCAAPNFLEVVERVKSRTANAISISTNGGMKNAEWWSKLGALLGPDDYVVFGIDGLEDLNHVYRVNVSWTKLMDNVQAFIQAGGRAHWQFIPFLHNQHQTEACRELASQLGFVNFFTVDNNRFVLDDADGKIRYGANGIRLAPPTVANYQSEVVINFDPKNTTYESFRATTETATICCESKHRGELYIDVEGRLFPCCYLGAAVYTLDPSDEYDGFYRHWTKYNHQLSLFDHTWEQVLASDYYKELEASWTKKYGEGRLLVCSAICADSTARLAHYDTTQ